MGRYDVAAAGVLSSVTSGDALDIKVAARLLSRVAKPDVGPLRIADEQLQARLRAYLKSSVELVLRQDDFNGEEKANLGSSIAQTLRTYASEMRERRRMRAEEKAHRLPVLLSVPLVTCMLPVMIGVLMLPAVIRTIRTVLPAIGG